MKNHKYIIFVVTTLLITTVFSTASTIKIDIGNSEPDAEIPVWNVGDSWTYDLEECKGKIGDTMGFEISSPNLKMEVEEVQRDYYKMSMSGDIIGNGFGEILGIPISGTLQNARITEGYIFVDKTTLTVYEMFDVRIKGGLPGLSFDASIDFYAEPLLSYLKFPLSVGDSWTVSSTVIVFYIDLLLKDKILGLTLIDETIALAATIAEHGLTCEKQETVNDYESLKITVDLGDVHNIWYSKFAGSIVQIDVENLEMEEYTGKLFELTSMKMKLAETNYNVPPSTPEQPDGPTSGRAGPGKTYCTSGGVDPEGKQVKYGFDFGDGSDIVWSDFVGSGDEGCVSHGFPYQGGSFEIKAKTRDQDGKESDWSEPLTVTMTADESPGIPSTPQGDQTQGIVGYPLAFTTTATDPEGDRIKYGFDLYGDGTVDQWSNLFDSGENAEVNLIWKQVGTFNMKVKAQDEYGAPGDWSQTVQVTMTNTNPEKPVFTQKTTRPKQGKSYTYSATAADPDQHRVQFEFDWRDGKTSKSNLVDSGETGSASHSWNNKGRVTIRVRTIDEYGAMSDWTDLSINVPKSMTKQFNSNSFFNELLNRFSFLKKLLNKPLIQIILKTV
jgi:hypothetical protein